MTKFNTIKDQEDLNITRVFLTRILSWILENDLDNRNATSAITETLIWLPKDIKEFKESNNGGQTILTG